MTITLSRAQYHQLLNANHQPDQEFDRIWKIPEQIGLGNHRSIQFESGIQLTIRELQTRDHIIFKNPAREHEVEFGFHLNGHHQDEYGNHLRVGQTILVGGLEPGGQVDCFSPQHFLNISIHVEAQLLENLVGPLQGSNAFSLKQFLQTIHKQPYFRVNRTTPAMQTALHQILHCPYQGSIKKLYLESKTLELMALTLDSMLLDYRKLDCSATLGPRDLEKIDRAREILEEQLDNPPSLKALAQQVDCNEYKLKQGFPQLFGTTVFGYLNQYRMECAQLLLIQQEISITEAAWAVGYTNLSAFSDAFRKQFGVSPRAYLKQYK